MKARNKETGEEYEVIDFTVKVNDSDFTVILPNDKSFEILLDEPTTAAVDATEPDWEQRKYELAKAAMQGLCAEFTTASVTDEQLVKEAIRISDLMIAELKKPNQ